MTDVSQVAAKSVPFAITDPERIPTKRYYDEEFYKLECERVWPHVWQMACRIEQVAHVGDWIEYSNLGKSVIVVRTKDGIKAFHNACRHRGMRLASGHGNCQAKGFVCPFHGWGWNMDGKNTFVYGKRIFSERQLDQADIALKSCRVELFIGCVFINFDTNATSLRESVGRPLAAGLDAYRTDEMHAEWWYATVLPANWKTAMEAFMEGYHVMRTHPQLQETQPVLFNSLYGLIPGGMQVFNPNLSARDNIKSQFKMMQLLSQGMGGMCHAKDVAVAGGMLDVDLPEDPEQALMAWFGMLNQAVTQQGRARGEPTPDLNEIAKNTPIKSVEFIFPHYFLLPNLSSMSAYRIRPLGPESCMFELWSLTHFPKGQEPAPVMKPVTLAHDSDEFPPIPRQDYGNIPGQQLGLHAEGFDFMRLSNTVEGLISNYHQLIDGYIKGAPLDRLGEAMTRLSGNFDGPIYDMGL